MSVTIGQLQQVDAHEKGDLLLDSSSMPPPFLCCEEESAPVEASLQVFGRCLAPWRFVVVIRAGAEVEYFERKR